MPRMEFVADIHLHSRWSRATSRDLNPENLHKWSQLKGIGVVGTADFTHPEWLAELKEKLEPAEEGLFGLRPDLAKPVDGQVPPSCRGEVRFLLTVEISSIYKRGGRTRKVHNVVCLPGFDAVDDLNRRLSAIGNLGSDGRPILGLDSRDLLDICLEVDPRVLFIPAHIWTPHFAVLGASSGFDSLEECFDDLLPHIFAVETGLSSDPPMNSRLSALDRYAVVSNSDAHSPSRLGREATCFDTDLSYTGLFEALRSRDPSRFTGTIEFYPEEGKYHYDGHRKCGVRWKPAETRAAGGLCPECGRKLTVGVLHRVESLADRGEEEEPPVERPFEYLIALDEVIGSCIGVGPKSKRVQGIHRHLLEQLGPELFVLRAVAPERVAACGEPLVAEGVRRMREGRVAIEPGYDGEYGVIQVFTDEERRDLEGQGRLFSLPEETPGAAASSGGAAVDEEAVDAAAVDAADIVEHIAPEPAAVDTGAAAPSAAPPVDAEALDAAHVVERIALEPVDGTPRLDALLEAAEEATEEKALEDLDDDQREAVRAAGPVAVIAGPGSGKTRTLTRRIAWMVRERACPSERIAAVTFTQRAAREMAERLEDLLGAHAAAVRVGTFHRLAIDWMSRLTGAGPPLVVDEAESLGLLRDVLARKGTAPARTTARDARDRISRWKADGLRPPDVAGEPLGAAYAAYQERLNACGARDYDDLLLDLLELLRDDGALCRRAADGHDHLLVDEFQDVNAVQYELVRRLAGSGEGLFVIGDPDQAIYGFRGADPRFFDRLGQDYPALSVHRLERNYRSAPVVVAASRAVIAGGRPAADVSDGGAASRAVIGGHGRPAPGSDAGATPPGPSIRLVEAGSEQSEAIAVVRAVQELVGGTDMVATDQASGTPDPGGYAFDEVAVLFRTGRQAAALEECFLTEGLPYTVSGPRRFLEERGARDAVAFFRYALEPERPLRLLEALRNGPFDAGDAALGRLSAAIGSADEVEAAVGGLPTKAAARVEALRRAAAGYARRAENEPPDKVLRVWQEDLGVEATPAFEQLLGVAAGAASMEELLDTLLLGREGDVTRRDGKPATHAVALMTMHAAKGLEFPVVILCGLEDGLVPLRDGDGATDLEEERRLLFVALTRARERLVLTRSRQRIVRGQRASLPPSPFLADLPRELLAHEGAGPGPRRRSAQLELF